MVQTQLNSDRVMVLFLVMQTLHLGQVPASVIILFFLSKGNTRVSANFTNLRYLNMHKTLGTIKNYTRDSDGLLENSSNGLEKSVWSFFPMS